MFCEKCGKSNPEGAFNCEACGAPLNAPTQTSSFSLPGGLDLDKFKPYLKPAIIVVAVIIVLLMFKGCVSGGAEKPIKNMIKFTETGKFKYYKKTMPKALIDAYDEDDLEKTQEWIEEAWENQYDEGKPRVSYKVEDKDKLDRDELEDIEEAIEAQLKMMDAKDDDVKVTKGYEYELEITTKYDGDKDTEDDTVTVVKVDGKWCLYGF